MGGVNHCSLHCRLAKLRGLMIRGKRGAVIGRKRVCLYVAQSISRLWAFFCPITAPYFPLIIKPRIFAKRQCKLQWLTPPSLNF